MKRAFVMALALARLRSADRYLLVRACVGLLVTDLLLRRYGLRGALQQVKLVAVGDDRRATPMDYQAAERYARWLEIASRLPALRARCLHRAVTLHRWLRGSGIPTELRLGVRKDGPALDAHAWVELEGRIIGDATEWVGGFTPMQAGSFDVAPKR